MGVVVPLATVTHALVPFGWGLAQGERTSGVAVAGVVVAVLAVAVTARLDSTGGDGGGDGTAGGDAWFGVLCGLAGGAAFGLVAVVLADVSEEAGMWPLVSWRAVSFPAALVALVMVRTRPGPVRSVGALAVAAGSLEVLGNGLHLVAAREGLLSLVGVLSSLNPLSTVALAALLLRERLRPQQVAVLAVALAGVALIAAG